MKMTTLCYIEQDDKYLMMHRVLKENDPNKDKWIGIGGHFEKDESPEECLLREVCEETGLTLLSYSFRGLVTFLSNEWETEYMFLFTSNDFSGVLKTECREGQLKWVEKEKLRSLPMWQGDQIFLKLLASGASTFLLKLKYDKDSLVSAKLNGDEILCNAFK